MNALDAWRSAVGAVNVLTAEPILSEAGRCTFAWTARPGAVLRPADEAQVQACVRAAAEHGQALYAVSRGRNLGFGSRAPALDGAVMLDLGRLDAIALDEDRGVLTVGPGVTFAAAHAFLTARGSRWFAPATGGPPDGSVLANALERGHGIAPETRRAAAILGLRVVLGDGAIAELADDGGPTLTGLFQQSTLGVVTRASLALSRRPNRITLFHAPIADLTALAATTDAMLALIEEGALGPFAASLWNRGKLEARSPDAAAPSWRLAGALYAPGPLHEMAAIAALRDGIPSVEIIGEGQPGHAVVSGRFLGEPTLENVLGLYRTRTGPPPVAPDPDRDGCGVLWVCPSIPALGARVAGAMALVDQILAAHGFTPNLGFNLDDRRTVQAFAAIVYDRDAPDQDRRALACHAEATRALIDAGCGIYRRGLADRSPAAIPLGARLKAALDPHGVFAPGPYDREV
ncbi:FAD-binding oxidoreductase [Caulobacter segnis]